MPLFGKPKISYVFIFYRQGAPTKEEQDKIVASLAKGRKIMPPEKAWRSTEAAISFGEARQLSDEDWNQSSVVRQAEIKALCSIWMAKNGIGTSGKGAEFKTQQVNGFIVAMDSQELVPMK
jgi:hypothetical protein